MNDKSDIFGEVLKFIWIAIAIYVVYGLIKDAYTPPVPCRPGCPDCEQKIEEWHEQMIDDAHAFGPPGH